MTDHLVFATRRPHRSYGEAEPVLVSVHNGRAELVLDDGQALDFDLDELREALEEAA